MSSRREKIEGSCCIPKPILLSNLLLLDCQIQQTLLEPEFFRQNSGSAPYLIKVITRVLILKLA